MGPTHQRWAPLTHDGPHSPTMGPTHPRWAPLTHNWPHSPTMSPTHPRWAPLTHDDETQAKRWSESYDIRQFLKTGKKVSVTENLSQTEYCNCIYLFIACQSKHNHWIHICYILLKFWELYEQYETNKTIINEIIIYIFWIMFKLIQYINF